MFSSFISSSPILAFLIPPLLGVVGAFLFPSILFPAPPSQDRLVEFCAKLAFRFFLLSIALNCFVFALLLQANIELGQLSEILTNSSDRIAYTLRWELASVILYFVFIVRVATARGADQKVVGGERTGGGVAVEFSGRVLSNTTEQLLLGVLSRTVFATLATPYQAAVLVPASLSLWITGRILFMIGIFKRKIIILLEDFD